MTNIEFGIPAPEFGMQMSRGLGGDVAVPMNAAQLEMLDRLRTFCELDDLDHLRTADDVDTGSLSFEFDEQSGGLFGPSVRETLEPTGGLKINQLDELGIILLSPEELEELISQIALDAVISGRCSYDQAVSGLVQGLTLKPDEHDEVDHDTYLEPFSIGGRIHLDTIWKLVDRFDIPVIDIDKLGLPVFEES